MPTLRQLNRHWMESLWTAGLSECVWQRTPALYGLHNCLLSCPMNYCIWRSVHSELLSARLCPPTTGMRHVMTSTITITIVLFHYFRGRSLNEGIVEFARKSSSQAAIKKCQNECLLLSSTPIPVVVTPLESRDEEEGVPEKGVLHSSEYRNEREIGPRFAEPGSLEWEVLYSYIVVV